MDLFEKYHKIGKQNITTSRNEVIKAVGAEGIKDIVTNVLLGGNVRDSTEFITQRRLLLSYASILKLFVEELSHKTTSIDSYADLVTEELKGQYNQTSRTLYLWLLGLTKKGLDNIVRGHDNIDSYNDSFTFSMTESTDYLEEEFGKLSGEIVLNNQSFSLSWESISALLLTIGSQTLTVRGSAKSTNGKMFEKLVLGSLLKAMDFKFYHTPPQDIDINQKAFYLSYMDEHERETDAVVFYKGNALSIDIGFIGKGNPEITLDKVTRFGATKRIGGIDHNMSTIIIVDTVGETSDLFNKANRVGANVLQMKDKDWVIQFANLLEEKIDSLDPIQDLTIENLAPYITNKLDQINMNRFFEEVEEVEEIVDQSNA